MSNPFDLGQYNTSFVKNIEYVADTLGFAQIPETFNTIAEAIKMRQQAVSIGYNVPVNSFFNVDLFDAFNPNGIVESIINFQIAIEELIDSDLTTIYGTLTTNAAACATRVGFFMQLSGEYYTSLSQVLTAGSSFSNPPAASSFTRLSDFTEAIAPSINELVYALNQLRYIHGKMVFSYAYDDLCGDTSVNPDCPPANDNICQSNELPLLNEFNCIVPGNSGCVFGSTLCATPSIGSVSDVWYKVTIPTSSISICGFGNDQYMAVITVYDAGSFTTTNWVVDIYQATPDCNNITAASWNVGLDNPNGFCLSSGSTYFIRVYNIVNPADFRLCWEITTCDPTQRFLAVSPPPPPPAVCGDPNATNFGQVGDCTYGPPPPPGCTSGVCNDVQATNFGICAPCTYPEVCNDPSASNYRRHPNGGLCYICPPCSGCCTAPPPPIYGCTDPMARNHDLTATAPCFDGVTVNYCCIYTPPPAPGSPNTTIPPPGCFALGTLVTTSDGQQKKIEDVSVGDEILSYSIDDLQSQSVFDFSTNQIENNKFISAKVTKTHRGYADFYYIINNSIKATYEHPFFVKVGEKYRFVEAQNLRKDYKIIDIHNQEVDITEIQKVDERILTANLTIDTYKTYVAENYVVHNVGDDSGKPALTSPPGTSSIGGSATEGAVGGEV